MVDDEIRCEDYVLEHDLQRMHMLNIQSVMNYDDAWSVLVISGRLTDSAYNLKWTTFMNVKSS